VTDFRPQSERIWCKLEPLLALYDRKPTEALKRDIHYLARAFAAALDKEAKAA